MQKKSLEEIEIKTRDILEEVLGSIPNIKPPINLAKVLEFFNLSLSMASFKDPKVAGAFDKGQKMIYLSKFEPKKRQFFTAAHELGHLVLGHKKNFDVYYRHQLNEFNGLDKEEEKQANYFAASLLLPKELVLKFWEENELSPISKETGFEFLPKGNKDLDLLAAYFGVSRSAAFWRLKNLGLI